MNPRLWVLPVAPRSSLRPVDVRLWSHATMSALNAVRRLAQVAPKGARSFQSSAARLGGGHADEPVRPPCTLRFGVAHL